MFIVHPHLLYVVEVYGNTCPTYIDKLCKLNNCLEYCSTKNLGNMFQPYIQNSIHYMLLLFMNNSY